MSAPASPSSHAAHAHRHISLQDLEFVRDIFHAQSATSQDCFEAILNACNQQQWTLFEIAPPSAIEQITTEGIAGRKRLQNFEEVARALNNIGVMWSKLKEHEKSRVLFEELVGMHAGGCPNLSDETIGNAYVNLGAIYTFLGRDEQALKIYQRALELSDTLPGHKTLKAKAQKGVSQKVPKEDSIETIAKIFSVKSSNPNNPTRRDCFEAIKKAAEDPTKRALFSSSPPILDAIIAEGLAEEKRDKAPAIYAKTVNEIANTWHLIGDYQKALPLFEEALRTLSVIFPGGQNINVVIAYTNVGLALERLGRKEEALLNYRTAIDITNSVCPFDKARDEVLRLASNLLLEMGRITEVSQLMEGPCKVSSALPELAKLFSVNKQNPTWDECFEGIKRAGMRKTKPLFVRAHPERVEQVIAQGLEEAKKSYLRGEHPDLAFAMLCIGNCWFDADNFQKALNFYEQSLEMYIQCNVSPNLIVALYTNISTAWLGLKNVAKNQFYIKLATDLGKKKCPEAIETGRALSLLGELQIEQTRYPEALETYNNALRIFAANNDHAQIEKCRNQIAFINTILETTPKAAAPSAAAPLAPVHAVPSSDLERVARLFGVDIPHPTQKDCFEAIKNAGVNRNGVPFKQAPSEVLDRIIADGIEEVKKTPTEGKENELAHILLSIGNGWFDAKECAKGLSFYSNALTLFKKFHHPNTIHRDFLVVYNNIGSCHTGLNDWDRSLFYSDLAAEIGKKCEPQSLGTAQALQNLGESQTHASRYQEARRSYEEARLLFIKHGKSDHVLRCESEIAFINTLLETALQAGASAAAPLASAHAAPNNDLEVVARLFGVGVPNPSERDCFDAIKKAGGKKDGAPFQKAPSKELDRIIAEGLKEARRNPLRKEKELSTTLIDIGNGWFGAKQFEKALSFHIEALDLLKKLHHPNTVHIDFLAPYTNIGACYSILQDWDNSLFYASKSVKIGEKCSPRSLETAQALYNLAHTQQKKGYNQEALKSYTEAQTIFLEHDQPNHAVMCEPEIELLQVLIATTPPEEKN